jgi:uroporphyrinogen decarboxylase
MKRTPTPSTMTSRERFLETMQYGTPDRVPYFEEGLRPEVIKRWRSQGLGRASDLYRHFPFDKRESIEIDLDPMPRVDHWPTAGAHLDRFRKSFKPDRNRLPRRWSQRVRAWRQREHVLMLYVHQGFFLSMGVRNWRRFHEVMLLMMDQPELVRHMMLIQGELAARMTSQVLEDVAIDAAIFSEPIGGNDRPLLSPAMYEEFVLHSYAPVMAVLQRYAVPVIIFQTFANARILIPSILPHGFNCLWACEVNSEDMDYRDIRRHFGKTLRLMGGIDLDALRQGKEAIRSEVETKVPTLLRDGGYVPLADGRVREDVTFENYIYYRQLLKNVIDTSLN